MAHYKFKIFSEKLEGFNDLKRKLEDFVVAGNLSVRSIGVEYLEQSKELLLSLGYTLEGPATPISMNVVNLGKMQLSDTAAIEEAMAKAADNQQNMISHELYITENKELVMIFLSER